MGLLTKEIRHLKSGTKHEPDVVDLVPVFLHRDRITYAERLQAHQGAGLTGDAAEHAAAEDVLRGRPILRALYIMAWRWETEVLPTGRGDHAWSWIHTHQQHGPAIRAAEADIDRTGAKGHPQELQRACNAWVDAWLRAIEDWMRFGGNR
jgi:hypothetical protein